MKGNYYNYQLCRKDGKNVFVELLDRAFPIDKVLLNFVKYNPANGNAQELGISIYINIDDFLYLSNIAKSGDLLAAAKKFKEGNIQKPLYQELTGIKGASLGKYTFPFKVPEGKAISKTFEILAGQKVDFVLKATYRLGNEKEQGIIIPEGPSLGYIMVPLSNKDMVGLFGVGEAAINGWFASRYQFNQEHYRGPEK